MAGREPRAPGGTFVDDGMIGGVLVGRYELTAELHSGKFGDFWKGRRISDGEDVAIKLLKPHLFEDPKAMARFEREISVLVSFRHDNLLAVLDHGKTHKGVPWIVTELHEGGTLTEVIADLSLTIERVRTIGAQVASVLAAAHERGIVHRGVDPEAIIVGSDDRVFLQDFGVAHLTSPENTITLAGERLGRYEYMAPEYIKEEVLNARTDLYSLGILLYEMLAFQPPFVGRPGDVLRRHVQEAPPPPSSLASETVPDWLDRLILGLLAKAPHDRPASGEEVALALRTARWPIAL